MTQLCIKMLLVNNYYRLDSINSKAVKQKIISLIKKKKKRLNTQVYKVNDSKYRSIKPQLSTKVCKSFFFFNFNYWNRLYM